MHDYPATPGISFGGVNALEYFWSHVSCRTYLSPIFEMFLFILNRKPKINDSDVYFFNWTIRINPVDQENVFRLQISVNYSHFMHIANPLKYFLHDDFFCLQGKFESGSEVRLEGSTSTELADDVDNLEVLENFVYFYY